MRILIEKKQFITLAIACFMYSGVLAQTQKTTVKEDSRIPHLITERTKLNTTNPAIDGYKIQLFSGKSEDAKKIFMDFKELKNDLEGTIVFNTPNYKVIVGNFETRIEAEKSLSTIKQKYPNALLLKPVR